MQTIHRYILHIFRLLLIADKTKKPLASESFTKFKPNNDIYNKYKYSIKKNSEHGTALA